MEPIEIIFWFDTTGSMYPCLGQVRRKVEETFTPLFKEMPNLKIGLGANGDYCDEGRPYVTKQLDFRKDMWDLTSFVRTVEQTGGGDLPECYELVLRKVQSFSWSPNSKKIVVLIADDVPHPVNYSGNKLRLDWRKEAEALRNKGIAVYAVQCLNKSHATDFYTELAQITNGYHLKLDQFSEVLELIRAVSYRQQGVERVDVWEKELSDQERMTRSLEQMYLTLTDKGPKVVSRFATAKISTSGGDAIAVEPGRFQTLIVDENCVIREFTKREEIQEKKEVVVRDKKSGDTFSGDKARYLIGVPPGTRGHASPKGLENYDIFIQSTSYNRKLIGGTRFLYEVDMDR